MTSAAPAAVRRAGVVVALEGLAAIAVAVMLVIRGFAGADQRIVNGFGTAVFFVLVGGAVLAAGWALWTGRRWGRGLAVVVQLLLLPVAWNLAVGSHRPVFGIPVAVIALATLVMLFSPSALRWASGAARPATSDTGARPATSDTGAARPATSDTGAGPATSETGYDSASSDSADPDTR